MSEDWKRTGLRTTSDPFAHADFPTRPPSAPPNGGATHGRVPVVLSEQPADYEPPIYTPHGVADYEPAPPGAYGHWSGEAYAPYRSVPTPNPPAASKHRKLWVAGVASLILVAGVGLFAFQAFPKGGAASPEQAMERFTNAAIAQDWMNLGLMIEPTERRVFLERFDEIRDELVRLEVIDDAEANPGDLANALDLSVTDLVTSVEPVNDDIYRGWIDSGRLSGTYDFSDMPRVASVFEIAESGSVDEDLASRDNRFPIALVKRDGKWYVSFWYTFAEATRLDGGDPAPDPTRRLTPIGADSPEQAATDFVTSVLDVNLSKTVAMMDPLEFGAVFDYWSLLGPHVDQLTAEIQRELNDSVDFSASALEWDVTTDGADAWVRPRSGRFAVEVRGSEPGQLVVEFDTEAHTFAIRGGDAQGQLDLRSTFNESSITVTGTVDAYPVNIVAAFGEAGKTVTASGDVGGEPLDMKVVVNGDCWIATGAFGGEPVHEEACKPGLGSALEWYKNGGTNDWSHQESALRMHRVDGKWYVSPTSTVFDEALRYLERLQPGDMAQVRAQFTEGFQRGLAEVESAANGDAGGVGLELPDPDTSPQTDLAELAPKTEASVTSYDAEIFDTDLGGTLPENSYDVVTITVTTTPVVVNVASPDFDTFMEVVDPNTGDLLAVNDNASDTSTDSAVLIPVPGSYQIYVSSNDANGGNYSFVVSAGEPT